MWMIASFVVGVAASYAVGRYYQHMAAKHAYRAAMWDMILLTMNAIPLFALLTPDSVVTYAIWIVGNGVGTLLVIKR